MCFQYIDIIKLWNEKKRRYLKVILSSASIRILKCWSVEWCGRFGENHFKNMAKLHYLEPASSVKNILKIFSGLIRFLLLSYSKFTISYLTAWKSILISASKNRCMLKTPNSVYLVLILENFVKSLYVKRSIFQTFWKPDFGARFLFFKLGIWNFGSS